jgi:hypothetical protein
MMKHKLLLLSLALLLIPAGMVVAQSSANFTVGGFVITSGGSAGSASFSVRSAIGQPSTDVVRSTSFKVSGGLLSSTMNTPTTTPTVTPTPTVTNTPTTTPTVTPTPAVTNTPTTTPTVTPTPTVTNTPTTTPTVTPTPTVTNTPTTTPTVTPTPAVTNRVWLPMLER